MIKFTITSTKGGVGKTTLTANLGALLNSPVCGYLSAMRRKTGSKTVAYSSSSVSCWRPCA